MLTGTIAREPINREKVIYFSINAEQFNKPIQVVAFKRNHSESIIKQCLAFKLNDDISLHGKLEKNPRTGEQQIILHALAFKETPMPTVF